MKYTHRWKFRIILIYTMTASLMMGSVLAQSVPREEEKIPFLVTFGPGAPKDWGDDDHVQIYFFMVPASETRPLFLRIFDPEVGGKNDEAKGAWDTRTRFTVFGGKGAFTNKDARQIDPVGKFQSGTILDTKTFGSDPQYDGQWFTFGPFNPNQGEYYEGFGTPKLIFKVIAQGIKGNDGNLYRYFLSASGDQNNEIDGGDSFTYEYSFRLPEKGLCHIYPFMDSEVTAIRQHNFDFDGDGIMRLVSAARSSEKVSSSQDGSWEVSKHKIYEEEKEKVMDIQIVSLGKKNNNNVVFYVLNQYGEAMPFFNFPLGLMERKAKIRAIRD